MTCDVGGWPLVAPALARTDARPGSPGSPSPGSPPSLSVVIAAYRSAAWVSRALDSVAAQTVQPLEVVVCDDGSDDDTAAVVTRHRCGARLLRHERNRGAGAARNTAVRAARGEVVVLLDSDDTWDVRRLEAISAVLSARPDLDIVTTDAWMVEDGARVGRADELQPFEVEDQQGAILVRNFVFGHAAVRRPVWLAAGGFAEDLRVGEDWVGWQQMIRSGARAGMVALPLADYRRRGDSVTGDRGRYLRDRLELLERAARRDDLRPTERAALRHLCRQERLKTARHALAADAPDTRRRWRAVARDTTTPLRTRALASLTAVSPRLGRLALVGRGALRQDPAPVPERSA